MNKPIDDGGPAFPAVIYPTIPNTGGMSLRAYFAGQAMAAMVEKTVFDQPSEDMLHKAGIATDDFNEFVAHMAVGFADALIAELRKDRTNE